MVDIPNRNVKCHYFAERLMSMDLIIMVQERNQNLPKPNGPHAEQVDLYVNIPNSGVLS